MDGTAVAGGVVTAATALAGLILICIGAEVSSFGSDDTPPQPSVENSFAMRAWLAYVGLVLALLAAGLGVVAKWIPSDRAANVAVWALLAAFAWAALTTILLTLSRLISSRRN